MVTSLRFIVPGMLMLVVSAVATRSNGLRSIGIELAMSEQSAKSTLVVLEAPPESEISERRCAAKIQVVAQIAAGELDLFEAAAHFRYLNHQPPEYPQLAYRQLAGRTDEEKLCRQVISWVESHHRDKASPKEVKRLVADLEAALESRLRRCTRIELRQ